ncbi:MAG: phosphonate C-P lyase system protein PhnH [Deltaproteobacteria bacterium]|nr:phosphonate C-P lyase system protein PhnH [Deltaproteobacteria bacterium]
MHSSVYPTQKIFRVLVEATSHPGRGYRLPTCRESDPWRTSLLAVAYTLLDHEVAFAFIGKNIMLAQQVYAATKARQVAVEDAHYVIVEGNQSLGQLNNVNCGTSAYPDQGATIIYALSNDGREQQSPLTNVFLSGPGIKEPLNPQLTGLSIEELNNIHHLNGEYPLGIDCIFLNGDCQVMCIPRSTEIKIHQDKKWDMLP